tara:strand:- start:472 stop:582 length:111 start_codon:yes stop_codon:yes gene_type:complete
MGFHYHNRSGGKAVIKPVFKEGAPHLPVAHEKQGRR